MKKKAIISGMAIVGIVLAGSVNPANAAVLFSAVDDFSYPDGNLGGRGSSADEGWAGAWQYDSGTTEFQVTGGVVSGTNPARILRQLSSSVGWHADGKLVTISFDMDWSNQFSALEAFDGPRDGSTNRVINFGLDTAFNPSTALRIGGSSIGFTKASGINSYAIVIEYGASAAEQAAVELFQNGTSAGTTTIAGTFQFDRLGFAAFQSGSIGAADNLSITQIPEPGTLGLLGAGMGWLLLRRRRSA